MSEIEIEQVIVSRIKAELNDAEVQLRDMTGTRDHWEAVIISKYFEGLRPIVRQQRVYKALGELMTGPVHAFTMMTLTPEEAEQRGINIQSDQDTRQSPPQGSGLISLE